jgi:transcriptional regulator with XRE-family HTH domain
VKFDSEWFKKQLAANGISLRELARKMNLDASAVSLMLRGQRKMTMAECKELSGHLGHKMSEIMRAAGIENTDDAARLTITMFVDAQGHVKNLPKSGANKTPVFAPADIPKGASAFQIRAAGAYCDAWIGFVSPAVEAAETCVGRFGVCTLADGEHILATITRGYAPRTYTLTPPVGKPLTDQKITEVALVPWLRPS